jgi:hypothetical protein
MRYSFVSSPRKSGEMSDPKCYNCSNPKSHHSKHDTHCLLVMNWKAEDFEESRDVPVQDPVGKSTAFDNARRNVAA